MARIKLKQLKLQGFRSFAEPATVDFPDSGLILIRGQNRDSGGSSGAGKSSVNLAIAYALGICHLPAKSLQSWHSDTSLQVQLTLEVDGRPVVISRGKTLQLEIDGAPRKGSVKVLEEELQNILGLKPELLEALTYRRQMSRGQFLAKTDAEKKEFLTCLLGLEKFEVETENTQEKIKAKTVLFESAEAETKRLQEEVKRKEELLVHDDDTIVNTHTTLRHKQEQLSVTIADTQQRLKNLKETMSARESAIKVDTQKVADSFLPKLEAIKVSIQVAQETAKGLDIPVETLVAAGKMIDPDCLEKLRTDYDDACKIHAALSARDAAVKIEKKQQIQQLQKQLNDLRSQNQMKTVLQAKGREKLLQLEALEKNLCPTCNRTWDEAKGKIAVLEHEMSAMIIQIDVIEKTATPEKISELENAIMALQDHTPDPEINEVQNKLNTLEQEYNQSKLKNDEAIKQYKLECALAVERLRQEEQSIKNLALTAVRAHESVARESLQPLLDNQAELMSRLEVTTSEYQSVNYALATASEQVKARALAIAASEAALENARTRYQETKVKTETILEELNRERDFAALIGREGFLGSIFDEVLFEIADDANQILASIPNVAHVNIAFRSEGLTQKGTLKKSIVPVVQVGGIETQVSSGCSGGMYSAIELAVDLAVAATISRRTGAVPAWMILDEAFEGLGVVEKEGCLEILSRYSTDKIVLVVDHASETKSAFSQVIDIVQENGYSRLIS